MGRLHAWKALILGAVFSGALGLSALAGAAEGMDPHGKGAGGPGMDHLHALAVGPRDGTLLMGTHDGLHRSTDEGKTWTKVAPEGEFPGRDVMAIAVDPKQPEVFYAAGHDLGVVKSTDGGRRWQATRAGLPAVDVHALTLDPNDPRKLYAWVDLKGLYRSLDAGRRWARVDDGPENPDVRALLSVNIPTGMGGTYLYGGTSDGLFRSMD
jgi:photosystem II stability/assembly factor-like uncharacterized protein